MIASLRLQFLLPMWIAVIAIAGGITCFSKWTADRASYALAVERLSRTGKLCIDAKYPLTPNVLTQIQDLSGSRLAIVSMSPSTFRVENASQGFPSATDTDSIRNVCNELSRSESRSLHRWTSPDGQNWNAFSLRLPQSKDQPGVDRRLVLLESTAVEDRANMQAFLFPMISGICSLIAIAIVATFVASRIGQRIERLKLHVASIANGSFDSIAPVGPRDAIYSLYESVNSMSHQLNESTKRIAQHERSRLVNLIASGLAHELRNQLTGARLALQTCPVDPHSKEAITIALKQMQLAEASIKRLLAMRTGAVAPMGEPQTVQVINQSVLDLTGPIAKHQTVSLEFVCVDQAHLIPLRELQLNDGDSVVGAIINLVLNAIEAAGPNGTVEVRVDLVREHEDILVEWQVSDNGPGPSDEVASKMFEPFATTKREGVGLGLAICKQVATQWGGSIDWARRTSQTVFVLRLKARSKEPLHDA